MQPITDSAEAMMEHLLQAEQTSVEHLLEFMESDIRNNYVRRLLLSFARGHFEDILPSAYVEDIRLFMAEQLSMERQTVLVSLVTHEGSRIIFVYDIKGTPEGLQCSQAKDVRVPSDSGHGSRPEEYQDLHELVINVGL